MRITSKSLSRAGRTFCLQVGLSTRHLAGQHDQQTHGRGGGPGLKEAAARGDPGEIARSAMREIAGQTGRGSDTEITVESVPYIPGSFFSKGQAEIETGKITLRESVVEDAKRYASGARDEEAVQAVHVVVHETAHVASPITESARIMQNEAIEEVTTELVSRVVMKESLGVRGKIVPKSNRHRFGSYQKEIKAGVDSLARQTGMSTEQAADRLIQASKAWRGRVRMSDYREGLFSFIEDLGVDRQTGIRVAGDMTDAYHGRKPR